MHDLTAPTVPQRFWEVYSTLRSCRMPMADAKSQPAGPAGGDGAAGGSAGGATQYARVDSAVMRHLLLLSGWQST